jgi:hypothetical protein
VTAYAVVISLITFGCQLGLAETAERGLQSSVAPAG